MTGYLGALAVLGIVLAIMAIPLALAWITKRRPLSVETRRRLQVTVALYVLFGYVAADHVDGWSAVYILVITLVASWVVAGALVRNTRSEVE